MLIGEASSDICNVSRTHDFSIMLGVCKIPLSVKSSNISIRFLLITVKFMDISMGSIPNNLGIGIP